MLEEQGDDGVLRRLGVDKARAEADVVAALKSLTSSE